MKFYISLLTGLNAPPSSIAVSHGLSTAPTPVLSGALGSVSCSGHGAILKLFHTLLTDGANYISSHSSYTWQIIEKTGNSASSFQKVFITVKTQKVTTS